MRVRILEKVNEHPMSPVQFVNKGLAPGFKNKQQELSFVSYHFRALEKAGCIELAEIHQRRGASEHVYRGRSRVLLTQKELNEMSLAERQDLGRASIQGLIARADVALTTGTFDQRTERHLSWMAINVDVRAWKELMTALAACYGEVDRIHKDGARRLVGSEEEIIPVTVAMLGFESPPQTAI